MVICGFRGGPALDGVDVAPWMGLSGGPAIPGLSEVSLLVGALGSAKEGPDGLGGPFGLSQALPYLSKMAHLLPQRSDPISGCLALSSRTSQDARPPYPCS